MRDLSKLAMELANACVPSAESELPLSPVGRTVLVGNAHDRILAALRSIAFDHEPPAFVAAADNRVVYESADVRERLAEILATAFADPKDVLEDPRGLDVLLDAIVCTFRDAASDVRTMNEDEIYELMQDIYKTYGITPKLREAAEQYMLWAKETGHEI